MDRLNDRLIVFLQKQSDGARRGLSTKAPIGLADYHVRETVRFST